MKNVITKILSFYLLLTTISGCATEKPLHEAPDILIGFVAETESQQKLRDVRVRADIHEANFVSIIGPEGVTRPQYVTTVGAITDVDGKFLIDLQNAKANLKKIYPDKEFILSDLIFLKIGYSAILENCGQPKNCNGENKTFYMKKK